MSSFPVSFCPKLGKHNIPSYTTETSERKKAYLHVYVAKITKPF